MKYLTLFLIVVACLIGCKKEDPALSAEESYLAKMDATWQLTKAIVDSRDATASFTGFAVTLKSDKTYAIANGPQPMWRPAGTFELKAVTDSLNPTMILDDQKQIYIIELNETSMILEFTWNAPTARRASVNGKYRFELRKV